MQIKNFCAAGGHALRQAVNGQRTHAAQTSRKVGASRTGEEPQVSERKTVSAQRLWAQTRTSISHKRKQDSSLRTERAPPPIMRDTHA